jgi:integrase/recombinase XerD
MVYFKLLLNDKRPKADNIYPIVVRVTYDRNNTTFTTGVRVNSEYWDNTAYKIKHNHPNAQTLNKSITEYYNKVQNQAIKLIDEHVFSFEELKTRLSVNYQPVKVVKPIDFKQYAEELIADMYSINKAGNAIIYQTATNRLMAYIGNRALPFTDINYTLLDGFRTALIKNKAKQNTISNYFRTIRAIYNKAIKAKLVDRSHYPFLDISIKTERTAKRALQISDLIKIATLNLKPSTPMWNARNYFMLSFCLIGISFTDLAYLRRDSIKKGRLKYARKKTGTQLDILLQPYALKLITDYNLHDTAYMTPILPNGVVEGTKAAKRIIGQWIKTTNYYLSKIATLCSIDADITSYVARHSWATTAKRLGYSIEMIAEAMGHEHGNKITNIYLDTFDQNLIDEMNGKVIESVTK